MSELPPSTCSVSFNSAHSQVNANSRSRSENRTAIISGVQPSMLHPFTSTPFAASACHARIQRKAISEFNHKDNYKHMQELCATCRAPSASPLVQALSSAAKESDSSKEMLGVFGKFVVRVCSGYRV